MSKPIKCILVVEDDRAVRDLIVAFLKNGGFPNVVTAGNAEEALYHMFKDAGLEIELALVDLVLPNSSGLAMIRKVRSAKSLKPRNLPMVVLTSRTDTETYQAAVRRGMQGYLMKPVSADFLISTVKKVLAQRSIGHSPEAAESNTARKK